MKWLLSLIFLTSAFIVYSFFIDKDDVFPFRWMTLGMGLVSFIQYYIVLKSHQKDSKKIISGQLSSFVIKFILSLLVVILYAFFFEMKGNHAFIFFFVAYLLYSITNYIGAYYV